jgi:dTDP-4-amino-4,6-dideoxygalactose transaminase
MIPFFNVREQDLDCQREIDHNMHYAMSTGQMYSGEYLDQLREIIAMDYGNIVFQQITLTNSGTSALITALIAMKIPANKCVLMPTMTYAATAQAVRAAGLRPVFVDVDSHYLMDMKHLNKQYERFRPSVGAVIAVDLYGQQMDTEQLNEWCKERNLKVILDAAQSYGLRPYATDLDAICLSFNPLKNWGGTGGGAVITNIHTDLELLRAATHEGKNSQGIVVGYGTNMRMDSIQAAVLLAKRDYVRDHLGRKNHIHSRYRKHFVDIMPLSTDWRNQIFNPYVSVIAPQDPVSVRAALDAANIEHRSHYAVPLHMEPAFERYATPCPHAESLAGRLISLPNHWHLRDDQVDTVIAVVQSAL